MNRVPDESMILHASIESIGGKKRVAIASKFGLASRRQQAFLLGAAVRCCQWTLEEVIKGAEAEADATARPMLRESLTAAFNQQAQQAEPFMAALRRSNSPFPESPGGG